MEHRINLKESEKKDKYLDFAWELKKMWNMKVTIVPIVIGALGTITKGLLKGLEVLEVGGRVETIQLRALLRTARILRKVLETWGDLLCTQTPVKNSKGLKKKIIIIPIIILFFWEFFTPALADGLLLEFHSVFWQILAML